MKTRLATLAAMALLALGLSLPQAALAQAGGSTGTGSGPGTTSSPGNSQIHGSEIDMPIGGPAAGMEEPPPPDQPSEDDPPKLYDEDLPTKTDSIIYVIDISGSMDWDSRSYTGLDGQTRYGTRMDRAKVELIKSISALSPNFEFNIIAFDCSIRRWSGAKQKAEPGPKASAIAWTNALQPTGATGTGPAVAAALGDKTNYTVVCLSDGAPNCGASSDSGHLSLIRAANTQGAVVHAFGIACYGSFEQFMRNMAQQNGGRYVGVP